MFPQQGTPSEIERVFAAMEQQRPDAVLVSGEGDLYAHRQLIAELAEKKRLPTICPYRDYVEAGGLMAYAVDLAELLRRMADDGCRVLGTKRNSRAAGKQLIGFGGKAGRVIYAP
jgi:putative tryptophan/tyrosine transport system substrate-binding protein